MVGTERCERTENPSFYGFAVPWNGKDYVGQVCCGRIVRESRDPPGRVKLVFNFVPAEPLTSGKLTDEDQLSHLSLAKVAGSLLYIILV